MPGVGTPETLVPVSATADSLQKQQENIETGKNKDNLLGGKRSKSDIISIPRC